MIFVSFRQVVQMRSIQVRKNDHTAYIDIMQLHTLTPMTVSEDGGEEDGEVDV